MLSYLLMKSWMALRGAQFGSQTPTWLLLHFLIRALIHLGRCFSALQYFHYPDSETSASTSDTIMSLTDLLGAMTGRESQRRENPSEILAVSWKEISSFVRQRHSCWSACDTDRSDGLICRRRTIMDQDSLDLGKKEAVLFRLWRQTLNL